MKKLLFFITFTCTVTIAFAQNELKSISIPDTTKKVQVLELACGECKFHLAGHSCDLAVKINGKAYFVDGATIDDFGDAHAQDVFCKAVRKAEGQGEIVHGRFKATYLKLSK